MQTTFNNGVSRETTVNSFESFIEDIAFYFEHVFDLAEYDGDDEDVKETFEALGSFYDYGLSFDLVCADTFDDGNRAYFRYQISWGGPSTELRFYEDGSAEWVHLDWFTGHGIDVGNHPTVELLRSYFKECMMMDWDSISFEDRYSSEEIEG